MRTTTKKFGLSRLLSAAWSGLDPATHGRFPRPEDMATLNLLALSVGRDAIKESQGQQVDPSACARKLAQALIPVLATSSIESMRLHAAFDRLKHEEWIEIGHAFKALTTNGGLVGFAEESTVEKTKESNDEQPVSTEPAKTNLARSNVERQGFDSRSQSIIEKIGSWWKKRKEPAAEREKEDEKDELDELLREFVDSLAQTFNDLRYSVGVSRPKGDKKIGGDPAWRAQPSDRLDVRRTVEKTVRAAGHYTPVYHTSRNQIDFVFLVKRLSTVDHEAVRCRRLIDSVRDSNAPLALYYYQGDMSRSYALEPQQPTGRRSTSFTQIRDEHPSAQLVLMSDGAEFVDPIDGTVPNGVRQALALWPQAVLITPSSSWEWHKREAILAKTTGLTVLQSRSENLNALSDIINHHGVVMDPVVNVLSAPDWISNPPSWVYLNEPPAMQRETALFDLESFLGDRGMRWVTTCSLYPELRPELTLALGQKPIGLLKDGRREPVYSEELFARLCRLPWFRIGLLPRWVEIGLQERFAGELDVFHKAYSEFNLVPAASRADSSGLPVNSSGTTSTPSEQQPDIRNSRRSVSLADLTPRAANQAQRALAKIESDLIAQIEARRSGPRQGGLSAGELLPDAWRRLGSEATFHCLEVMSDLSQVKPIPKVSGEAVGMEYLAQGSAIVNAGFPPGFSFSDIGFGHLMIARGKQISGSMEAKSNFDDAVDAFRKAGREDILPIALLSRAAYLRKLLEAGREDVSVWRIHEDLDEAEYIADSDLRTYLTDICLERARLKIIQPSFYGSQDYAAKAEQLIAETGYHLRDSDLLELKEQTASEE